MSDIFPNHSYSSLVEHHKHLPIVRTDEFDFFRCVAFDDSFYGKTVSELHKGNLREKKFDNRYSELFPYQKVSYWSDSPETARAELKARIHTNNLLTFRAYDDATSTFPTLPVDEPLIIIDGRELGFHEILYKFDHDAGFSNEELKLIYGILKARPDCLAYTSKRHRGGVNFMFFEKGFRKLAVRQVRLRLGDNRYPLAAQIDCATGCDYAPYLDGYGEFFAPKARIGFDRQYLQSCEYDMRSRILDNSYERYARAMREQERRKAKRY